MDESRYLQCLAADYDDLRDAAAAAELTVPVPNCPGWTMGDLVFHVAEGYLHQVTVMRTVVWPDPMLRWLWGRAGDDAVRVVGEQAWAGYLRRMQAAVTE